jgi:hypothetical protein
MVVSFEFFATHDPPLNMPFQGNGGLSRGVIVMTTIQPAADSWAPTLANILSLEHRLLNRKKPISPLV